MNYIKSVMPMKDCRLFMEMESGSCLIVDLSVKLHTIKFKELEDETLFATVCTDGNYVVWGDGRVKLTVKEMMEVVLTG